MAGTPSIKGYFEKEYRAAFKYWEDALSWAAFTGEGATLRFDHSTKCTVWRQGREPEALADSYDLAADECIRRKRAINQTALDKTKGQKP